MNCAVWAWRTKHPVWLCIGQRPGQLKVHGYDDGLETVGGRTLRSPAKMWSYARWCHKPSAKFPTRNRVDDEIDRWAKECQRVGNGRVVIMPLTTRTLAVTDDRPQDVVNECRRLTEDEDEDDDDEDKSYLLLMIDAFTHRHATPLLNLTTQEADQQLRPPPHHQ